MNENEWDKLLKIHTTGTDNTDADQYRYPYEPTPYSVLERLGNSGSALNIMNGFMQRQ